MAKAIVTCTCTTCGAEFTKTAVRSSRRAADEWCEWAKSAYDECPECYRKRKQQEAEIREQELNETYNLPSLEGTPKQVAWAEKIRILFIENFLQDEQEIVSRVKTTTPEGKKYLAYLENRTDELLAARTKASWWIDNRSTDWYELISEKSSELTDELSENDHQQAIDQTTVKPEGCKRTEIVEMTVSDNQVSVIHSKDADFRTVVKSAGYSWDGETRKWVKRVASWEETNDVAAEIACKLLNSGFPVSIQDSEIRRKAVEADYTPAPKRVICKRISGNYAGWFAISWARSDDLYKEAKAIKGSKYHAGNVVVPAKQFADIIDFAESYGFLLTDGAKNLIEQERAKITIVNQRPTKEIEYNEHRPEEQLENPSYDVLSDLVDD